MRGVSLFPAAAQAHRVSRRLDLDTAGTRTILRRYHEVYPRCVVPSKLDVELVFEAKPRGDEHSPRRGRKMPLAHRFLLRFSRLFPLLRTLSRTHPSRLSLSNVRASMPR